MRKNLHTRLIKQAEEAKVQGLDTISAQLNSILPKTAIQEDVGYVYSSDKFDKETDELLWSVAVKTADFYDLTRLDMKEAEQIITQAKKDLIESLCKLGGIKLQVGKFEEKLPGEDVVLEVADG